jgi:hypothetical protein
MRDPIKAADAVLVDMGEISRRLVDVCLKAVNSHFGLTGKRRKREMLEVMGGIPGVIRTLAAMEMPKGFTPYRLEAQAPMFELMKTKGKDALKVTVTIEILCLKEDTDG